MKISNRLDDETPVSPFSHEMQEHGAALWLDYCLDKITFLKKLDSLIGPFLAQLLSSSNNSHRVDVRRVLFIRPGGIGDAVLLIPAIQALCLHCPQATVDVLAEKRNAAVFELCPHVGQVFCYDHWRDWQPLFTRYYDLIIDTEQWHYLSAIISRLLRSPTRCGFATNDRQKLFTHTASYCHDCYEGESFFRLLEALGINVTYSSYGGYLHISSVLNTRCAELLRLVAEKPYVALFPGASIEERRWGVAAFHALAERCNRLGYYVVVVGGGDDVVAGEEIVAALQGINLAGKTTLPETAAVLKGAELLVSGDSGVLHLAAGVDCPSVALFGPGIIKKWAPHGDKHRVVSLGLPCSPCTRFGTTAVCADGGKCINDIPVAMVFDAVKSLIEKLA